MSGYPFTRKEQHHHIPLQQRTADTVAMRGSCVIGTPWAYSEHAKAEQRMLFTSHTFPPPPPVPHWLLVAGHRELCEGKNENEMLPLCCTHRFWRTVSLL